MKKAALPLWLATITLSPVVPAQTPPATSTPSASAAPAVAQPELPNIEDPMLAPAPAPIHILNSWREALELLRSRSTQLRTQFAQVDVARARSREALSAALPQLASAVGNTFIRSELLRYRRHTTLANGEVVGDLLPDPNPTWGAGLSLRIPAFAPKAWYDARTADENVHTEELDTKEVERQVVGSVADTIVSAVTAERLSDVTRESLRSALSTLDLTHRRASLGASSALDVLRADGEVQTARSQVVTADETLLRARESLGLALGSPEGWAVTQNIHLDELAKDARASCHPEPDVNHRSDVRAAAANLHVVERAAGSVDWAFWPTVDAVSQLQYENAWQANGANVSWTIGLNLNWNLYDGGLRYGQKDEAKATARIAREALTDTQRRAQLDVTQALRGVGVAETNLAVSAKARDIAAETARLARVSFVNGSGTSFDLVDTASKQREAELDLIVKQFEVLRARVAALLAISSCDV
jgi:outer membrane protein TolC